MSDKRKRISKGGKITLSAEEMEIQEVLSDSHNSQSTGRTDNADPPPANLSTANLSIECMEKLSGMFSSSLSKTMIEVFKDHGMFDNEDSGESKGPEEGEDDSESEADKELPSGWPCQDSDIDNNNNNSSKSLPKFGIVNEEKSDLGASYSKAPKVSIQSKSDGPVDPDVVEPDQSLPSAVTSRAPTNWHPHPQVLAWAVKEVDNCDWSAAVREIFESDFSPEEKHDHLFTAVKAPQEMLDAEQHPDIKKKDYLFKRFETEEFLHDANKDIVCGYRPLLEVISNLTDIPEMAKNRNLLAHVFQCMASSANNISRGRRELGRRFVPLENASALFRTKPSHHSFFGDSSDDTAVTKAVAEAKVNKSLVIMPKKRKFMSFRFSHRGGKAFFQSKDRYQNQNYRQNFYKNSGKFGQGQRGQRYGNRRKRKPYQANSKNSTQ